VKRVAQIFITIIGLSFIAGLAHQAFYSLQGNVLSGWAQITAYLVVVPLASSLAFVPGLIAGYFFGTERLLPIAVAGFLAYLPFQLTVKGQFIFDLPTASAYAAAFAITTVVSALAGAQAANLCRTSNNSFKADSQPLRGRERP
jgi:hypothetical protein